MMNRFLVASLGSIGRRHLENLRRLRPDAQLAVLRTSGAAAGVEDRPAGVDHVFHSLDDALSFEPHAAVVASPASHHVDLALALLEAGVPTLIEKPLSTSSRDLGALLRHAQRIPAAVGYNLRLMPSLIEARALITQGAIGDVMSVRAEVGQYLPDWRPATAYQHTVSAQQALGGGALLELSHELDYIYWMFGSPSTVTACGGTLGPLQLEVEDLVELLLSYEQPRRLVSVHLDFLQRAPHRTCRFIGTEGTLVWDGMANSLDLYTVGTRQWQRQPFPALDRNRMYIDELEQFLDLAAGGSGTLASVQDAHRVLCIVDAARTSLVTGQTTKVSLHE